MKILLPDPGNIQSWLNQQMFGTPPVTPPGSPKKPEKMDPFPDLNMDCDLSLSSDLSPLSRPRSAGALLFSSAPRTTEPPSAATSSSQPTSDVQAHDHQDDEVQHGVDSSGTGETKEASVEQRSPLSKYERNRLAAKESNKIRKKSEKYMNAYFNIGGMLKRFDKKPTPSGASSIVRSRISRENSEKKRQFYMQNILGELSSNPEFKPTYEVCCARIVKSAKNGLKKAPANRVIVEVIERLIEEKKLVPLDLRSSDDTRITVTFTSRSPSHSQDDITPSGGLAQSDRIGGGTLIHSSPSPTPEAPSTETPFVTTISSSPASASQAFDHQDEIPQQSDVHGEVIGIPTQVNTQPTRKQINRDFAMRSNEIRKMAASYMNAYFDVAKLGEGFEGKELPENVLPEKRKYVCDSNCEAKKKYIQQKMLEVFKTDPRYKPTYDTCYAEIKSESGQPRRLGNNRIIVEVIKRLIVEGKIHPKETN
jgi:hypothetical protein